MPRPRKSCIRPTTLLGQDRILLLTLPSDGTAISMCESYESYFSAPGMAEATHESWDHSVARMGELGCIATDWTELSIRRTTSSLTAQEQAIVRDAIMEMSGL